MSGCSSQSDEKTKEKDEQIIIKVQDLTAPTIEIKQEKVSLHVGDTFSINNYLIGVYDNFDRKIKYKTSGEVDTTRSGVYTIMISAKDKAGNASNKKIVVTVKEKEVDKKEDTKIQEHTTSSSNSQSENSQTSPSTQPSYSTHPYSGKQYLFSAGYDNISASQACANDLMSIPNAAGSCSALYDATGEPIGVILK